MKLEGEAAVRNRCKDDHEGTQVVVRHMLLETLYNETECLSIVLKQQLCYTEPAKHELPGEIGSPPVRDVNEV